MSSHTAATAALDVLDAIPAAVVLADQGRSVTGWNAAAETLYGHLRADVVGRPVLGVLFHADDRRAARRLFDRVGDVPWEGDFRVCRRDGALLVSSFRLASYGPDGGWAWIATDGIDQGLAEQERSVLLSAERAARATAEEALGLVEAILASAPVGIAVFDTELRYVRVNDAYAALSGVPADDHAGVRLGDVVAHDADVAADLRRAVTTGRTILGRPVELRPDGPHERRSFTASYFPVRATAGVIAGAGLTLVEVTEAKRAEAERAALLHRAEAARQRLSILATASSVLSITMDLDELLKRLAKVLVPAAADWCVIELIGRDGEIDHVGVSARDRHAAEELEILLRSAPLAADGEGPVAEVVRTGQARLAQPPETGSLVQRASDDRGLVGMERKFSLHSSVIVPIRARGAALGVLILSTEIGRSLDEDDLDLAVEVGQRAALAVENARAFQQEHQIAESLQRALLPAAVPSVVGLDLAVRYLAATDGASVGGDWYDVLAFDDGATGLVVGDVVGHDIAASTSMGQLRSALRAFAHEKPDEPAEALARIDRLFDSLGLTYASCVLGVVDLESSTFRWSNAGHPPPLLLREGRASFLEEGNGVLLGVTGGSGMRQASTELREGDLLVLYTDGLVERRSESLQDGLDRLAAVSSAVPVGDAGALCDALLQAMVPPTGTRDDDLAILVARVRTEQGPPGVHRLAFDTKPKSAALARGFTAGVLQAAGWLDQVDTAVLLVSEIVTNAVRHAKSPCSLVVSFRDGAVELSVEDGDPRPPAFRSAGALDQDGRGLLLIGALADDWGVRSVPGGKATWFVLRRSTD